MNKHQKPALDIPMPAAFYLHTISNNPVDIKLLATERGHTIVNTPIWERDLHNEEEMFALVGVKYSFDIPFNMFVSALALFPIVPATVFRATPKMLDVTPEQYELALVMAPSFAGNWVELRDTVKNILK